MERRRRERRRRLLLRWLVLVAFGAIVVLAVLIAIRGCGEDTTEPGSGGQTTTSSGASGSTEGTEGNEGTETTDGDGGSDGPATSGTPAVSKTITTVAPGRGDPDEPGDIRTPGSFYGPINTTFEGLTMFRGNASRTYYGEGPAPKNPEILWKFGPMVGSSSEALASPTGTGWTG